MKRIQLFISLVFCTILPVISGFQTSVYPYTKSPLAAVSVKSNVQHLRSSNKFRLLMSIESESKEISMPLDKPVLASIDFASLVTFAGVGKASHSADGSLDIAAVFLTAFPFLVAWYTTSPLTGVYKDDDGDNVALDALKVAAKGWIIAVPLGCVLRGIIKGYVPPAPFVIVTMIATLVILGGTRVLYAVVEDKMNMEN